MLADTRPLYAALDPSDDNHVRTQGDIDRLNSEGLGVAVAYPTLCECYSLVLYRSGIQTAHGWLREVRDHASPVNPTPRPTEGADEVFVNGDSFIPEARPLEGVFKRLMLAGPGVG